MRKYKVSELSHILGISEQAIRSKVKRNILPSVEETIDNRSITFVPLDDYQLNELINKTNKNKNIYPTINATIEQQEENIIEPVNPINPAINFDNVIDYLKQKDQQLENIYSILMEKERNIGERDKQIFLLEDSERRKESEYLRQIAELKAENEKLKKNSWKFWKK